MLWESNEAQVQIPEGMEVFRYAAGKMVIQSRRFLWVPRQLPLVSKNHGFWDGKTYRFAWLTWVTLRGTEFGWEAIVKE